MRRFFVSLSSITFVFVVSATFLFHWVEHPENPQVSSVVDSLTWVTMTIPFVMKPAFDPVTSSGLLIGGLIKGAAFLIFCLWSGLFAISFLPLDKTKKG